MRFDCYADELLAANAAKTAGLAIAIRRPNPRGFLRYYCAFAKIICGPVISGTHYNTIGAASYWTKEALNLRSSLMPMMPRDARFSMIAGRPYLIDEGLMEQLICIATDKRSRPVFHREYSRMYEDCIVGELIDYKAVEILSTANARFT